MDLILSFHQCWTEMYYATRISRYYRAMVVCFLVGAVSSETWCEFCIIWGLLQQLIQSSLQMSRNRSQLVSVQTNPFVICLRTYHLTWYHARLNKLLGGSRISSSLSRCTISTLILSEFWWWTSWPSFNWGSKVCWSFWVQKSRSYYWREYPWQMQSLWYIDLLITSANHS
jgi:hypothetical protein